MIHTNELSQREHKPTCRDPYRNTKAKEARLKGKEARIEGRPITDNYYQHSYLLRDEFKAGWRAEDELQKIRNDHGWCKDDI